MFHGHLDYFQKTSLGGTPNTKLGDHGTPNSNNGWFILFYHVWGPARIEIHWYNIWLRARSHMASHYTWGSTTTLHDFGSVLRRSLDTFFWALTISWSRLLACVWSCPWSRNKHINWKSNGTSSSPFQRKWLPSPTWSWQPRLQISNQWSSIC